jgi:hypothetical protein
MAFCGYSAILWAPMFRTVSWVQAWAVKKGQTVVDLTSASAQECVRDITAPVLSQVFKFWVLAVTVKAAHRSAGWGGHVASSAELVQQAERHCPSLGIAGHWQQASVTLLDVVCTLRKAVKIVHGRQVSSTAHMPTLKHLSQILRVIALSNNLEVQ